MDGIAGASLTSYGYAADTAAAQSVSAKGSSPLGAAPEEKEKTLIEAMQEAREKADKIRDQLKVKPSIRYSDLPVEAYARLARARNRSQVGAAAGYAQRQICRLKQYLRTDPDRSGEIKAAIQQLQKAQSRSSRKVRDLEREARMVRLQKKKEAELQRQSMRIKHELQRRRAMRSIREGAYLHEAAVSGYMEQQMSAELAKLQLPGASTQTQSAPLITGGASLPSCPPVSDAGAVSGADGGISVTA